MQPSIKTAGQLRNFLVTMIQGVKDGDLDENKARNITKMVAQINESFYSEIKIARVMIEAGQEAHKLGSMPIGESQ